MSQIKKFQEQDDFNESFPRYAFEIVADMLLAITLGIVINTITNFLAKLFNLSIYVKIVVQLVLIILVLYIMKIDSKYLYSSWKGQTSYGIIFTAIFLATQKNIALFLEEIYSKFE